MTKKEEIHINKYFFIKLALVAFIALAVITGACSRSENNNPPPEENLPSMEENQPDQENEKPGEETAKKPADYFPLTKGSTWQYLGEGNEFASFTREVIFASENRAQIKEDNGGTVSAAVFETTDETVTRIFFQGEAYVNEDFLNAEPNDNLVILKTPLQVGTKWETADSTREIIDLNASLDTPAGKFDQLLKIKITFPDSVIFEYYKDGVGMVKREFESEDIKVTSTLEKFEIQ